MYENLLVQSTSYKRRIASYLRCCVFNKRCFLPLTAAHYFLYASGSCNTEIYGHLRHMKTLYYLNLAISNVNNFIQVSFLGENLQNFSLLRCMFVISGHERELFECFITALCWISRPVVEIFKYQKNLIKIINAQYGTFSHILSQIY